MKKSLLPMLAVAILFAGIGIFVGAKKFDTAPPASNATAQLLAQTLPDAGGQPQSLSQWQGKHLVVNFWATWCAPCVEEMPELTTLQSEIAPRNIQILGIGIDSSANIAEFSTKYKIGYPLYVAGMEGTQLSREFGNQAGGLPFTVLIGSDGKIRKTYLGRLKMDELRKDLAKL
jgi:thiol-disulfide isomerase/thioredoxin